MPWEFRDTKGQFLCQVGDSDLRAVSNRETAETCIGFGMGRAAPEPHPRNHEMKLFEEPLHRTLLRAEQDFGNEGGKPNRLGCVRWPDEVKANSEYELKHVGTGFELKITVGKKRSKNPPLLGMIIGKNIP